MSHLSRTAASASGRVVTRRKPAFFAVRHRTDYAEKYASKLEQRAEQESLSVDALRQRAKEAEKAAAKERLGRVVEAASRSPAMDGTKAKAQEKGALRKDATPIKPLSSILNVERILASPHTPEQVSALWTAYHASRAGGTGRGVICASVPRPAYETMLSVASRHPQFILPVPRSSGENEEKAYEFFMLQWDQYDAPPPLMSASDPFAGKADLHSADAFGLNSSGAQLPRAATAIFTPLGEYKLRQTLAAPHLALTFYPDLAHTHGLVLLRGELTPRTADPTNFLLSQQDAQVLAMGLQRFYLWGTGGEEREKLLKTFYECPEEFKWEELVRLGGDVLA